MHLLEPTVLDKALSFVDMIWQRFGSPRLRHASYVIVLFRYSLLSFSYILHMHLYSNFCGRSSRRGMAAQDVGVSINMQGRLEKLVLLHYRGCFGARGVPLGHNTRQTMRPAFVFLITNEWILQYNAS